MYLKYLFHIIIIFYVYIYIWFVDSNYTSTELPWFWGVIGVEVLFVPFWLQRKSMIPTEIGPSQGPRKLARFFLTCLPFEKRKHSKDMHHLSSLILTWCITRLHQVAVSRFSGETVCCRHYELMANGCIPIFHDLELRWWTKMVEQPTRGLEVIHNYSLTEFPVTRIWMIWHSFVTWFAHDSWTIWFWFNLLNKCYIWI